MERLNGNILRTALIEKEMINADGTVNVLTVNCISGAHTWPLLSEVWDLYQKDVTPMEELQVFTYVEYCDYLQKKHGIGKYDYMTKSWNKNPKCTRTKEGLIAHHKYENCAIMLSKKEFAMVNPFEWQLAKNIVYCDYLEHLLLHVLICEYPSEEKNDFEAVGIGGVINFIVPELNDFYSGWVTKQEWQKECHELIKEDKDVYLTIIKRFNSSCKNNPFFSEDCLFKSFNEQYGLWSSKQNKSIYNDIKSL